MNGSIAHECTGGDQLIFDINMCFVHIRVKIFAAHILQNASCRSIWPPADKGDKRAVSCSLISSFFLTQTSDDDKVFYTLFRLFVLSHSELTARQDFGSEDRGDATHA